MQVLRYAPQKSVDKRYVPHLVSRHSAVQCGRAGDLAGDGGKET